jgi:TrmH RNA methyltransferase
MNKRTTRPSTTKSDRTRGADRNSRPARRDDGGFRGKRSSEGDAPRRGRGGRGPAEEGAGRRGGFSDRPSRSGGFRGEASGNREGGFREKRFGRDEAYGSEGRRERPQRFDDRGGERRGFGRGERQDRGERGERRASQGSERAPRRETRGRDGGGRGERQDFFRGRSGERGDGRSSERPSRYSGDRGSPRGPSSRGGYRGERGDERGREQRPLKPRSTVREVEDFTKFVGVQACLSIVQRRTADVQRVFIEESRLPIFQEVLDQHLSQRVQIRVVEADELSRVAGTQHHEGVCVEASPAPLTSPAELMRIVKDSERAVVLLLEGVENPHNIGAILRTACFFGVTGVVISSKGLKGLSGSLCRIAEGAVELMPIVILDNTRDFLNVLEARGFTVVATTPHDARSLYEFTWPEKSVVMFGAEGTGLSASALGYADERISIPSHGPLESLNVGASVAAVLSNVARSA